jgi:hypothetical protein
MLDNLRLVRLRHFVSIHRIVILCRLVSIRLVSIRRCERIRYLQGLKETL